MESVDTDRVGRRHSTFSPQNFARPLRVSIMPRPRNRPPKARDTHARQPNDRLMPISRLLTRFIRHGQGAGDGPQLAYTPKRQIHFHHIPEQPIFKDLNTEEAGLRRIANDLDDRQKKRIYIRYEGSTASYLLGVYNGHSLPVEGGDSTRILNPWKFCHATSRSSALNIIKTGLRAVDRGDIHVVPLAMDALQASYLRPAGERKSHIAIADGHMASHAGIAFQACENGVVTSRWLDGSTPPCCIASVWANARNRRDCLSLGAMKEDPPSFGYR